LKLTNITLFGKRREILLDERNVGEPELGDRPASDVERARRQVASHKARFRKRQRHRNQVGALVATDFEHAALRNRRRTAPQKRRDGGQPVGMRL